MGFTTAAGSCGFRLAAAAARTAIDFHRYSHLTRVVHTHAILLLLYVHAHNNRRSVHASALFLLAFKISAFA